VSPPEDQPAQAAVESFLSGLDADTRRVAGGEWGLTLEAGGSPLHVGLALRDGVLRAQASVMGADQLDPLELLHRNRRLPHVRFSATRDGEIWVEGDLPVEAVTSGRLDAMLGVLVGVVTDVRTTVRHG